MALRLLCMAVMYLRHASVLFVLLASSLASADPPTDKSLSPYFVVEGSKPGVEAMPLEATHADVHISGVIADVVVRQTYRNEGDQTINARYVFPASTRAAVYGMQMTIGDRTIVAKIKEREAARADYEAAKKTGKTASLLEEDRPNVFSMSVANILPKDKIDVELRYTELLVPTDGVYELAYPTVVGPRYVSERADAKSPTADFTASPYTHGGVPPTYDFGIAVHIAAGMPIAAIDSPSHAITTSFSAKHDAADIALAGMDPTAGTKDFILHYQLAGAGLQQGLLLFPGGPAKPDPLHPGSGAKESFFLTMVQPPRRPAAGDIPAREYVFIVDVSGSMEGFPLTTAKHLMHDLLGRLRPTDTFDVLLFSGADELYAKTSVPAVATQIDAAERFIDAHDGGGGTELLPAIQHAMTLPRTDGVSRSFVVVTDGYIAEEPAVFDEIRDHLGEANVFSFGIGTSVNRHLMEGVAKAGQGEAFIVTSEKDGDAAAAKFRDYVEAPVLTKVEVAFDGLDTYDVQPKVLPDVFAERPVIVFGKYRGEPKGTITLTGVSGHGRFVSKLDVAGARPDAGNAALAYLWARAKVSELSDFYREDANQKEVTALGLQYNLLTKFTSFIAVEDVVRTTKGSTDVDQPLPMPAGVSDASVAYASGGGSMSVGDEPPLAVILLLVAIGIAAANVRHRLRRIAQ
ncbi:MAG TPA: VIT domain-containing protein [Kofleriaceae bacterium]|jgi:Ca-activated chloride channel family protein